MIIKECRGMKTKDITINYSQKRYLIVDDFANFRSAMKTMLHSFGAVDIDEVGTGEEAVNKLALKRYDFILCDYNLGKGKDGQQVLEEARERGLIGFSTIFMMITAENTMEMFMGAVEYQPDEYLMKPFTKTILENKLAVLSKKKANLREIEQAMRQKDYQLAETICSRLIGTNPVNLPELLRLKGEILIKNNQYAEAAEFYAGILKMGSFPWAMLGLGKAQLGNSDYAGAKETFTQVIAHNDKITSAYDLLSMALEKTGNIREAQDTLMKAVIISPKAIFRQKTLGNIALQNNDYETAEKSFRTVVKEGKNSYLKSASDYVNLAKVLIEKRDGEGSVAILRDAANEFPTNHEALLQINLTKVKACQMMQDTEGAKKAVEAARQWAGKAKAPVPRDVELELAKAYYLAGENQKGEAIFQKIVQNSHDDESVAEMVKGAFREMGMEQSGADIIEKARKEVYALNNEGVRLVRQGELDQAIDYFEKAVANFAENKNINANAALAYILYMKKHGARDDFLKKTELFIRKVIKIDPAHKDLPQLQKMLTELVQEN